MVCPWCGFNNFKIYHDENGPIYECQTCSIDPFSQENLVTYTSFEAFTRKYYMQSPEVLVKLRLECYASKFPIDKIMGFTCYKLRNEVCKWLGIPELYWDKNTFWIMRPSLDWNVEVYEGWLKTPRIALDFRQINQIYNRYMDCDEESIVMYLANLILKSKREYHPCKMISHDTARKLSYGDNCGGGNLGQAVDDFDNGMRLW